MSEKQTNKCHVFAIIFFFFFKYLPRAAATTAARTSASGAGGGSRSGHCYNFLNIIIISHYLVIVRRLTSNNLVFSLQNLNKILKTLIIIIIEMQEKKISFLEGPRIQT